MSFFVVGFLVVKLFLSRGLKQITSIYNLSHAASCWWEVHTAIVCVAVLYIIGNKMLKPFIHINGFACNLTQTQASKIPDYLIILIIYVWEKKQPWNVWLTGTEVSHFLQFVQRCNFSLETDKIVIKKEN